MTDPAGIDLRRKSSYISVGAGNNNIGVQETWKPKETPNQTEKALNTSSAKGGSCLQSMARFLEGCMQAVENRLQKGANWFKDHPIKAGIIAFFTVLGALVGSIGGPAGTVGGGAVGGAVGYFLVELFEWAWSLDD